MQSYPLRLERPVLEARGMRALDALVAAGEYGASPLLRIAIHRFKYDRVEALKVVLGSLLIKAAPLLVAPSSTVLCPVPLHWVRQFHRGFNQSYLLAKEVGAARGWEVRELLRRTRYTMSQTKRTTSQRKHAMHQVFVAVPDGFLPSHVVLIDDVSTTGATLDACAETLKRAGISRVEALVVAC